MEVEAGSKKLEETRCGKRIKKKAWMLELFFVLLKIFEKVRVQNSKVEDNTPGGQAKIKISSRKPSNILLPSYHKPSILPLSLFSLSISI